MTGIFFFTQVAFAHMPESNFWAERQKTVQQTRTRTDEPAFQLAQLPATLPPPSKPLEQMTLSEPFLENLPPKMAPAVLPLAQALPASLGTIRKITVPEKPRRQRIVIQIQDVHMNQEAQKNIGAAVASLIDHASVGLVALEGESRPLALEKLRSFPHRQTIKSVADYLLRENKISGPLHAALVKTGPIPPVIGVDDIAHYKANVQAYKDSLPRMDEIKGQVAALKERSRREYERVLNKDLAAFEEKTEAFHGNKMPLGTYVRWLADRSRTVPESVRNFIEALTLEETLHFPQVEAERSLLLKKLAKTLTPEELSDLLKWSLAYRMGTLPNARFYQALKTLCEKKGVSLDRFPSMAVYVRYVLCADRVDAERLLKDIDDMEKNAEEKLVRTPAERKLIESARYNDALEKLAGFSLTPEEWKEYRGFGFPSKSIDFLSFESFYREADERNRVMTRNLLGQMDRLRASTAVVVTGGFHAASMAKLLEKEGVTVISFVPKLSKVETDQGSAYLSVFAQEKTPLEKLVAGEKLFLADGQHLDLVPPLVAGLERSAELGNGLWTDGETTKIVEVRDVRHGAEVTVGSTRQADEVVLSLTLEGHRPDETIAGVSQHPERNAPSSTWASISRPFIRAAGILIGLYGSLVWIGRAGAQTVGQNAPQALQQAVQNPFPWIPVIVVTALVLLALVGGLIWYFQSKSRTAAAAENPDYTLKGKLPEGAKRFSLELPKDLPEETRVLVKVFKRGGEVRGAALMWTVSLPEAMPTKSGSSTQRKTPKSLLKRW
jgi:hypothetical protein